MLKTVCTTIGKILSSRVGCKRSINRCEGVGTETVCERVGTETMCERVGTETKCERVGTETKCERVGI